jgi:hypothetical protein
MRKSVLIVLATVALTLAGCQGLPIVGKTLSQKPAAGGGDPMPISVDITSFNKDKTNLISWSYVFSSNKRGTKFLSRAASFGSAEELARDTQSQLKRMRHIKGKEYVTRTISQRFASQVNFSSEDLAVVYFMDGGPPFGTFGYSYNAKKELVFCMNKPKQAKGKKFSAFNTVMKMYRVPKGTVVKTCS